MTLIDFIIIGFILLAVGGASAYVIVAKKRGQKCIGCPNSKNCSGSCQCNCGNKENRSQT